MYAVKTVNLLNGIEHYTKCYGYAQAWDAMRREMAEMEPYWHEGEDYTIEVVEVDDDFDFENQPEWN